MSEQDRFRCQNDPLESLTKELKWPELAERFGPKAWVYSEIATRAMIYEAYQKGFNDGKSGQKR